MKQRSLQVFNEPNVIYAVVRETLEDCGIDCQKQNIFRYFVDLSLSPLKAEYGRNILNDDDVRRSLALANLALYLDRASSHCQPLYPDIGQFSPALLCAIAMRALPQDDEFFPHAFRVLTKGDFRPVLIEASKFYLESAQFHSKGALNMGAYKAMSSEGRFITELHAVHFCELALATNDLQSLYPLLHIVAPYGPVLEKSESAMALHFNSLFERLSAKVPGLAVPMAAASEAPATSAKLHVFMKRRLPPPPL